MWFCLFSCMAGTGPTFRTRNNYYNIVFEDMHFLSLRRLVRVLHMLYRELVYRSTFENP